MFQFILKFNFHFEGYVHFHGHKSEMFAIKSTQRIFNGKNFKSWSDAHKAS